MRKNLWLGISLVFLLVAVGCQYDDWHTFIERKPQQAPIINTTIIEPQPEENVVVETGNPIILTEVGPDASGSVSDPNMNSSTSNRESSTKETYIEKHYYYGPDGQRIEAGSGSVEASTQPQTPEPARDRRIQFDIRDKDTKAKIAPDRVMIAGRQILDGDRIELGWKNSLEISKRSYKKLREGGFEIPPGDGPYLLSRELGKVVRVPAPTASTKVEFDWFVTGDYPPDEEIEPEYVALSGKEVSRGDMVDPGSYSIEIRHPGYRSIEDRLTIPKGPKTHKYEGKMISLPRPIKLAIRYDFAPQGTPDPRTTVTNTLTGETMRIRGNEKLKPSTYEVEVTLEAYEVTRMRKNIFPGISAYSIDAMLQAKPRVVQADVDFDIRPPADLDPHVITFLDLGAQIRRKVEPGKTIKPGNYEYEVEKPGYKMSGNKKRETIWPSENPFYIQAQMIAQPRRISFNMLDGSVLVEADQILIDNNRYDFNKNVYKPGKEYQVMARFQKYRTIDTSFTLPPGLGPHVVELRLQRK